MSFIPAAVAALALFQGSGSAFNDIPAKYRPIPPAATAVVARVNGVEIKASDVEALLWEWRGFDVIQDLISYQIVKNEADKLRVSVSDKEVEDVMAEAQKQMAANLQPGQTVDQVLLQQGFTKSRLFLRYKTEGLMNAIVLRSYDPKKLVKVSTILVRPDNETMPALTAAINKAQAAYDRLAKGDKWEDVLKSLTNNQQLIQTKGLIGRREFAAFPTTVQAEFKTMKVGGFSKPTQTENGIQIFRIEAAGASAKPAEQKEMQDAFVNGSKKQLLETLRGQAHIERLYPPIPGLNSQKDGN